MSLPGFVLAGGASRRMGRDKALIEIDGLPMAARVAQAMAQAGCTSVHLVGNQPALKGLGWPVLTEAEGPNHPLRGVVAALAQLPLDGAGLFSPCDLVAPDAHAFAALLAQPGGCVAAAGGRRQNLMAVFPAGALQRAQDILASCGPAGRLGTGYPTVALPGLAAQDADEPGQLPPLHHRKRHG